MSTYYKEPRPVRKIPTPQQIAYSKQRAAMQSRKQPVPPHQEASPHRSGRYSGMQPEDTPYLSGDLEQGIGDAEDEIEEDGRYYDTRLPTSTRRYQQLPDVVTSRGKVKVISHFHDTPLRAHRPQLPPPQQHERYTDEIEEIHVPRQRRIHPLVWFGLFCTLLVLGWIGLNVVTTWYQGVRNDWTYGTKRHFEIDAVVGHNDSATNPSHFTAENDNGQIIVIELPGGNVSKAMIYQIETVPGNAGNPPVKLSFQDMNADGKPDMLVQIGDGETALYVTLFNNGSQFVSKL